MNGRRTGMALVAALSLISLLGLLVVGAVSAATISQRAARMSSHDGPLAAAADYALASLLIDAARYQLAGQPFGVGRSFAVDLPSPAGISASASVTRLPDGLLWIVAESRLDGVDGGRRRTNLLARFPWTGPLPAAGVMARGPITLAPDVRLTVDSAADPDCAAPESPPFQTSDSSALIQLAWQRARLDSVPGVVHVRGDTTILAGSFSGILLVDGDLTFDGPFTLTGLAIAAGRIRSPGGLTVLGAVISYAAGPTAAIDVAGAVISHSPCAVSRLLRAARPPVALRRRGWAELF